jgi:hypothetical protein
LLRGSFSAIQEQRDGNDAARKRTTLAMQRAHRVFALHQLNARSSKSNSRSA